jgi:hypothetical protein
MPYLFSIDGGQSLRSSAEEIFMRAAAVIAGVLENISFKRLSPVEFTRIERRKSEDCAPGALEILTKVHDDMQTHYAVGYPPV